MKGFRFHGKDICINGKSIQKLYKIFFSSYILFDDNNRYNSYLHRPVFHYHKPWFGLKAVLTDKEYQCIGSLRNFDYDSLIVGSSVAEKLL